MTEHQLILFPLYLNTNLTNFITFWYISDIHVFDRKIAKYPCFFIDKMGMSRRVTLIIRLTIYPRESSDHPFFCHRFNISVDGRASDLRISLLHFIKDILSGEMPTLARITDDVSVLVFSHIGNIMINNLTKSNKKKRATVRPALVRTLEFR
jgi:hypothetical protein